MLVKNARGLLRIIDLKISRGSIAMQGMANLSLIRFVLFFSVATAIERVARATRFIDLVIR